LAEQRLPILPTNIQKINFCELNDNFTKCKSDYFDEGVGISPLAPLALFSTLLGAKFGQQGYKINQINQSNGGGLSLESNPMAFAGPAGTRFCSEVPGKIELMRDSIDVNFGASTCIQVLPLPIPFYYKTEIKVLLFDETNNEFIVKWTITKGTLAMYRSKSGIGKVYLN